MIKKLLSGVKKDWDAFVPFVQYAMNCKIAAVHRRTPFAVMFGRDTNAFADYSSETIPASFESSSTEHERFLSSVKDHVDALAKSFPTIAARSVATRGAAKKKFDSKSKLIDLSPDSYVMLRKDGRVSKLDPINEGPYKVVGKTKGGTYILQDLEGHLLPRNHPPSALISLSTNPKFAQDSYEVQAILDHRKAKNGYEYLVRWAGYNPSDDSWEPESHFDSVGAINAYWNRRKALRPPSTASQAGGE
jgi:hypothetical protein